MKLKQIDLHSNITVYNIMRSIDIRVKDEHENHVNEVITHFLYRYVYHRLEMRIEILTNNCVWFPVNTQIRSQIKD